MLVWGKTECSALAELHLRSPGTSRGGVLEAFLWPVEFYSWAFLSGCYEI